MAMEDGFEALAALSRDLGDAPRNVGPKLRSALMRTAIEIKKEARESVRADKYFKGAAPAIAFDAEVSATDAGSSLEIEIGYDRDKAGGKLGNLREFGAPNATYGGVAAPLAPKNDLKLALENNAEDFERGIDAAIDDALREAGL